MMARHTTLLLVLLAGALSLALFTVSYQVQDLEDELRALNSTIIADTQAIRVLKAEWSHLNDPARLRDLSKRHLKLRPVEPDQLATLEGFPRTAANGGETATDAPATDFATAIARALAEKRAEQ